MKKTLSVVSSTIALLMMASPAIADPAMFGDNASRTHQNGIDDPLPWVKVANITSLTYQNQQYSVGGGNGTATGDNNDLVFPVSSPNDDPKQAGFLVDYDTSSWGSSNFQKWVAHVEGISNSTPLTYNSRTYIAAGDTLYGFDASGLPLAVKTGNLYVDNPIYQNQIVSHPLYVTATQMGRTDTDLIWVSSQNGLLYAIDPSTLDQVYAINIGSRMDGSPSLVTDTTGKKAYIAVATAYSPSNTGGTGTLYLIDPTQGTIVTKTQPSSNAVVTAPVATSQGNLMYNDIYGNVFWFQITSSGTLQQLYQWNQVGGNGVTTNEEAGYSKGFYILPFSSGKYTVAVNANNPSQAPVQLGYLGNTVSSPELSNDYLYVADDTGTVNQFDKSASTFTNSGPANLNFATGLSSPNLTNPMEAVLGSSYGPQVPTLALNTTSGLQLWQSIGANYSFGSDVNDTYTSGQPISFKQALSLSIQQSNLDQFPFTSDKLDIAYSVDGGAYQALTSVNVYDSTGKPIASNNVPTSSMSQAAQTWSDGKTHTIKFRVTKNAQDQAGYRFNGQDQAVVTYTYAPPGSNTGTGGTSGGGGATAKTTMNLSIKYNSFNMPAPIGGFNVPVTVSNDGDQDVTTDVTLTRNGQKPIPVYYNNYDANGNLTGQYVDHYNNVSDTQTYTQTVTIPKHGAKQVIFTVYTGQRIIGTATTGFQDDPQYTIQLVADVNKGQTIIENTYSDNETSMWVPTAGKKTTFGPPRIIE